MDRRNRHSLKSALKELIKYRELLFMITYRDIRIRYKQSVMGFLWAIFMPTLIVLAGVLVRYAYSTIASKPFSTGDIASVAVRSLPWALTVSAIRFGTSCLISNGNLVTKIYFPREIFPISAVVTALFDFLIASTAITVLLMFFGVGISVHIVLLPVLLLILVSIITGAVTFFASAALFFRDVKYLVEILLTFGIFFTPVFFSVETLGRLGRYLLFNPISPILEAIDSVVIAHQWPDMYWVGYSAAVGAFLLVFGYKFFKNLEPAFAESI